MTTDPQSPPTTRRRFLRQTAGLLGAGTGVLLLQTAPAAAAPNPPAIKYHCCRDSSCKYCPGAEVRYNCVNTGRCGGVDHYCTCASSDLAPCFDIAC